MTILNNWTQLDTGRVLVRDPIAIRKCLPRGIVILARLLRLGSRMMANGLVLRGVAGSGGWFPRCAGTSPLLCGDKRRAGAKCIAVAMR